MLQVSHIAMENPHPKHLGGLTSQKGQAVFITTIIFTVISIVAIILRIWCAYLVRRAYRLDDYFIFIALV
jgi:hypothetical protein